MKKFLAMMLALSLVLTFFAGCATEAPEGDAAQESAAAEGEGEGTADLSDLKIALVTEKSGASTFITNSIQGLNDAAAQYGFEAIIVECADAAAYEDNVRALVVEGVDLIIGGGWQAGEAINKMATEMPDACAYALIDSQVEAEVVKCISYREQESAYLVGMLAALATEPEDMTFGHISVNEGAGSWKWRYGVTEGIKAVKPEADILFNYVGSYTDPAKTKEFALQMFAQGAKFVNSAAAGGDVGAFEAAMEEGFYTSGQDSDLTTPDNPYIISSQLKDTHATITLIVEAFINDQWSTDDEVWGVKEGAIGAVHVTHEGIGPIPESLTEEELAQLKAAADAIAAGELLAELPAEEDYVM